MSGIGSMGTEFGQHVYQVTQELLTAGSPQSLSEMERGVRQALLRIGQFLLQAWLALQEGPYPEQSIPCPCGQRAEYRYRREGTLLTLLGTVRYQRAYYLCPHCHCGRYPLDERLGLRPGQMSAELESLVGLTGAQVPFSKGSDLFERLTLVGISPQSMDKATETLGQEVVQVEQEWKAASQDSQVLNAQERAGQDGRRLYGTLDAVKVHTDDRRSQTDDGWRDLKVGAWFLTDTEPPAKPEDSWGVKAHDLTYYCDFAEAPAFGELLWATAIQREALRAKELVFLGDGAEWIWNLVLEYFPQAIQIVDWFHAQGYLSEAAKSLIVDSNQRETWLQQATDLLWAGRVDELVVLFGEFSQEGQVGKVARNAVQYFTDHRERMNYAVFRAKGYQIGSGTVESACKQLGIQRLRVPGATWSLAGARHTAKARAALLSGQWDQVAARREHLLKAA